MARPTTINYERVTFSLPKALMADLRAKVGKNNMSKHIAKILHKDLEEDYETPAEFIASAKAFRNSFVNQSGKTSLELIREMRYGTQ